MRRVLYLRCRLLLVACFAMGLAPTFAAADEWTAFLPTPFENGAFFDSYTSFEREHFHDGHSVRWTDTFLREKVTLFSDGYSYHPRFLTYRFSIAGAARQEDYERSAFASGGWQEGAGLEYDATLLFLPEHPYNLEVYARRFEPLLKTEASTQHSTAEDSRGASFRYRNKPFFLHAGVLNDSIESGDNSSDLTRVNLDGQYFKRFTSGNEFSLSGGFNPSWFSNSEGIDGSSTEYLLDNLMSLQQMPRWWALPGRLTSSLSKELFDQTTPTFGKLENDQLVWYERLTVTPPRWLVDSPQQLPLNFRSDIYYRYQDNKGTLPGESLSQLSKDLQVDVVHRLYESVDTTYTYLDGSRTSTGGESSFLTHSLVLNYVKQIPWGRLLLGTNLQRTDNDNRGQSDIIDEAHLAIAVPNLLPGSFVLGQQNIDAATIRIYINCTTDHPCAPPLATGQRVLLVENTNYQVVFVPTANSYEIFVSNNLPPPLVPGTYDFLVSYSIVGDFKLRTDTYGGNASVELFDQLLTPYFSYTAARSEVLSGSLPGVPLDATTYITGLIVRFQPLQVRGEYQDVQWQISPYQAWRAEVQYVQSLSESTSVYASGSYLNKYYSRSTSGPSGPGFTAVPAYTEETESATGSIQKAFFDRALYLSAGGAYSHVTGLVDGNAYSVNGSAIWKIGKVDLTFGVTGYANDTSGTNSASSRRDHEFVYLNLRRRLF